MDIATTYSCPVALAEQDLPPVKVINEDASAAVLLIADHAGNAVPKAMQGLGLSDKDLQRHIAWDPGAAAVAENLAKRWQATAVLAQYSRLIVDPNRPLGEASSMPEVSDRTLVPANQSLQPDERQTRADLFYWPYHQAVEQHMARLRRAGAGPMLVSIHSFTPDFGSEDRPWHVGVMAAADRRLAEALMEALSEQAGLVIGDNQPYSGVEYGYTLKVHAGAQGLANVQIEIRQDLLDDETGLKRWTDILDTALSPLLQDQSLLAIEFH